MFDECDVLDQIGEKPFSLAVGCLRIRPDRLEVGGHCEEAAVNRPCREPICRPVGSAPGLHAPSPRCAATRSTRPRGVSATRRLFGSNVRANIDPLCDPGKNVALRLFRPGAAASDGFWAPHKFLASHGPVSPQVREVRIMFDQLFTSQRTIDHHSNSPLLEARLRYLAHCAGQGKYPKFASPHCAASAQFLWSSSIWRQNTTWILSRSKGPPMFGSAVDPRPTA